MNRKKLELMLIAGEASGDSLGAKLVDEIRSLEPNSRFYGAAGPLMQVSGVEADFEIESWSVTGFVPVLLSVPAFLRRLQKIKKLANSRNPDVVILIDFPEFNLKLAKALKAQGHKIVFYVSPQLWAWRKYRARIIRDYVDLVLSILPFEKDWYLGRGIRNVEYVGNPIADRLEPKSTKLEFCSRMGLDSQSPIIAMLPGSRIKELRFHLPVMIEASKDLLHEDPDLQIVFAAAGPKQSEAIKSTIQDSGEEFERRFGLVTDETIELLNAADVAGIASGTATLEAGILGTPMVIGYKMSKLDSRVLGPLVDVEHIGLVNLIAGKKIVRELIQDEFTSENLRVELQRLLTPDVNKAMREELGNATKGLGGNASKKAAGLIIELVSQLPK